MTMMAPMFLILSTFLCSISPLAFGATLSFTVLILLTKKYEVSLILGSGLGWDSVSFLMILLSIWITLLMAMAMAMPTSSSTLLVTLAALLMALTLAFSVQDLIWFYIYFEASLVPTFVLILGWGYQPERIQAGVYMLLYTVLASLPLLLVLLSFKFWNNSCSTLLLNGSTSWPEVSSWWLIALVTAFAVKLPLYAVHLWLPKAHVEAPVAGPMILAGVLLKLGGYGVFRVSSIFACTVPSKSWFMVTWAIASGALAGLLCLRQTDVKVLIALSSVAHMAMVMGGLFTSSLWGVNGAMIIMLGHGLCSSALFCIADMNYRRTGSRSFALMKGSQTLAPALTLWWFLLAVANMAAPPTLNLLGEMSSIIALLSWAPPLLTGLGWLVFIAAAYSLYLYITTQHGKPPAPLPSFTPPSPRESLTLLLHWAPLNLLILWAMVKQVVMCQCSLWKS
uniref:NADH-ubiquinone oxidoreductase chain 4 n=1 Tax=Eurydice pulchra TaxID=155694 RepID=E3SX80_EURPU|nr:NADH dehydrogenase subunit 4 [Eurydice pulchra]